MARRDSSKLQNAPMTVAAVKTLPAHKLAFNADAVAIAIALALAALVRLNVLPRIGW